MIELTVNRSNPMIDPSLHVWGWEVPVYLFLGGFVAGMMVLAGFLLLTGRFRKPLSSFYLLPGLGIALLSAGMLALLLDLEHKAYVWRLYTTLQVTSPMSWGSWILILVYPALAAGLLLRLPDGLGRRAPRLAALSARLREHAAVVRWTGVVNLGLGVALGVYTGVLLSSLGARPLWNSAVLGPLFLASGLSSAAAFTHLIAKEREERELFAHFDNLFLLIELAVLLLFFFGLLSGSKAHAAAARLLLGGPFTAVFWIFVVGAGIVVPLIVQPLAIRHRIQHTPVAPLLVMAGGLALRFVIVYAGQMSQWSPF